MTSGTPFDDPESECRARDLELRPVNSKEQLRIEDLMRMIPKDLTTALEIGVRDCRITRLLAPLFETVTALDLEKPTIVLQGVIPVRGDATSLEFPDRSFDVVICTEVLEHIAPAVLPTACREISRVAKAYALVGVPYRQDLRVARTKCPCCGKRNPPFGHWNSFDETKLKRLFGDLSIDGLSFVGTNTSRTNFLSAALWDMAGNPYGTYHQEEACGHCHATLTPPAKRTWFQKAMGKCGFWVEALQSPFLSPRPNWMHVLFRKPK